MPDVAAPTAPTAPVARGDRPAPTPATDPVEPLFPSSAAEPERADGGSEEPRSLSSLAEELDRLAREPGPAWDAPDDVTDADVDVFDADDDGTDGTDDADDADDELAGILAAAALHDGTEPVDEELPPPPPTTPGTPELRAVPDPPDEDEETGAGEVSRVRVHDERLDKRPGPIRMTPSEAVVLATEGPRARRRPPR